ncbi:hypothetical protein HC776_02430 [bacterium]|nr:hypothetical protein [bacterium]
MNYILSEDQYQQLMTIAHEKGWDEVETVLKAATPAPSPDDQDTRARQKFYDELVAFNAEMERKYPHLKDIDITAWIREDRERLPAGFEDLVFAKVRMVSDYMSRKYGPQPDIDDLIREDRER